MRKTFAVLAAAGLATAGFTAQANAAPCGTIVGDATNGTATSIVVDTTWGGAANPGPICLEEPIYIGDGTVAGATVLEILPGTIVRGQPRRGLPGGLDNNSGALIVTRFSQIDAEGTATAPIVMTTAAVDNNADGVCDDGNGDGFFDPHPGFEDSPAGCVDAGTCVTPETAANAAFCDATPLTSALSPLDADGGDNVSLWGGFAINGNAPTNLAGNSAGGLELGEGVLEGVGLPATPQEFAEYGGPDPHDSSGTVRYVSVRHAGDSITQNNELNGISLGGVGDGTVFEFNEVYANFDDGFEWFGGTVNGNHLAVTYAGDDQFDIDQGYTGNLQYLLAIMPFFNEEDLPPGSNFGSGSGDAVGEWDGVDGGDIRGSQDVDDADEDVRPVPFPQVSVWNLTAIGSTTVGANPAVNPAGTNRGVRMRNGFGGELVNSIIVNTGASPCVDPDTDAAGDSTAGFLTQDNVAAGLVDLRFTLCTTAPAGDAPAGVGNVTAAVGTVLEESDPNHDGSSATGVFPEAGMSETNGYDPRPQVQMAGERPQERSLDRSAAFMGAFEENAAELWTTGWTAAEISNMLSR